MTSLRSVTGRDATLRIIQPLLRIIPIPSPSTLLSCLILSFLGIQRFLFCNYYPGSRSFSVLPWKLLTIELFENHVWKLLVFFHVRYVSFLKQRQGAIFRSILSSVQRRRYTWNLHLKKCATLQYFCEVKEITFPSPKGLDTKAKRHQRMVQTLGKNIKAK